MPRALPEEKRVTGTWQWRHIESHIHKRRIPTIMQRRAFIVLPAIRHLADQTGETAEVASGTFVRTYLIHPFPGVCRL